jgi:hypothetical protein
MYFRIGLSAASLLRWRVAFEGSTKLQDPDRSGHSRYEQPDDCGDQDGQAERDVRAQAKEVERHGGEVLRDEDNQQNQKYRRGDQPNPRNADPTSAHMSAVVKASRWPDVRGGHRWRWLRRIRLDRI